jgi:transcriptional regulator with XRE-family HTH domain
MDANNFALRLNRLFKERRKADGKPYSQTEVLNGLKGVLTRVYLWRLRKGLALNPSFQVVAGLADFFAVNPGYFFESDQPAITFDGQSQDLTYEIGLRASRLDPEGQQMVLFMIDSIIKSRKPTNE